MDRLPDVSPPRIPSDARRMFVSYLIVAFSILLFGAAMSITGSITGSVPAWVSWVIVTCLLLPFMYWQTVTFVRLGRLGQQADTLASTVGFWSLTRGDVEVGGLLVPEDPADTHLFAYKITISLSEDTGHAAVAVLAPRGSDMPEHLDE
jgi:hypothetical protein